MNLKFRILAFNNRGIVHFRLINVSNVNQIYANPGLFAPVLWWF